MPRVYHVKKCRKETTEKNWERAAKLATVGLIGDGVREIPLDDLYERTVDQCIRIGEWPPCWSAFIDIVDGLYSRTEATVFFPSI